MLGLTWKRSTIAASCMMLANAFVSIANAVVPVGIGDPVEFPTEADSGSSESDDPELQYFVEELERENAAVIKSEGKAKEESPKQKNRGDVTRNVPVPFPANGFVQRQVRFWETVFQNYPSTTIIIHDVDEPDRVIDLIDFKEAVRGRAFDPVRGRAERQRVAQRYVDRYQLAVEHFRQQGEGALQYGAIERRIWSTYGGDERQREKLLAGDIRIRSQSGLSDTFVEAAKLAQRYLPYMEKLFADNGLPVKLTRLPFVESMFNVEARSKVGASGIWQFMPQTARLYMHVDGRMVDERNSPWKATRGAARLMQDNYQMLRSWPLAITAYNHGAAGMERAVREVGSPELDNILSGYRSKSFGFASRNFYAEFLAAANSYDWLIKRQKLAKSAHDNAVEFVSLPRKASVSEVLHASKLTSARLAEMNPCLLPQAFGKHKQRALPQGYELRLPAEHARKLRYAMGSVKARATISKR
ncbi:MAG: hypothetical protein EBU49_03005 [Proteobacteria bacterium]|nr:hypothetical protein [Pseudomonadota bacterium]